MAGDRKGEDGLRDADDTSPPEQSAGGNVTGIGRDRFTMAEAARLKGVSYHTVSRAVRCGRLPVIRLGRMALIAAEDLQNWRPMKERAPRKYRRREPSPGSDGVLVNLVTTDQVELAQWLSTLYEIIYSAASERSLEELAQIVTQRMAESFQLTRLVLWQVDEGAGVARRLAVHGGAIAHVESVIPLEAVGYFLQLAERRFPRIILNMQAETAGWQRDDPLLPDTPVLAIPLVRKDRVVGLMFGDRNGEDLVMPPEQLALAEGIANQMAMAIDNAMLRQVETQRRLQLEAILEELTGAVSAFDTAGRLTLVNAAERQLFDLNEEETRLGQHWSEYLRAKRRETLDGQPVGLDENPLVRALNGERVHGLEQVVIRKDGERRQVVTNARPIIIDGHIAGAVSITRDVTEQRESERRSREHLAQLELAARRAQAIAETVAEVNAGTDVEAVSDAAVRRITHEFDGIYGIIMLRRPDGRFAVMASRDAPNIDRFPVLDAISLPYTVLAFARHRPMLVRASDVPLSDEFGIDLAPAVAFLVIPLQINDQAVGVAYVAFAEERELTDADLTFASILGRQAAQAIDKARLMGELEFAHGRLLEVIDQLPQAVLIMEHPSGQVIIANQAAERLWARPLRDKAVRAGALPVLDADGMPMPVDEHPLLRPLRTRRPSLGEPLTVVQPDGTQVEVLGNHAPIHDARGGIVGAVSVLQNRADFKPLDRAKDEFISVVAHELRNPLTSLRGNLQLLQRRIGKRGDEQAEEELARLGTILDQVDRIGDLVSRMLDVSRVDLGRLDIDARETDAVALVRSVVNETSVLNAHREVRVSTPESLPVVWDAVRVQQILVNLLTNAARYAPEGPVEVTLFVNEAGRVVTTVRDHGPGVPPRIRRRLFKQYYRFDDGQASRSTAVDGGRGLGIGLYVSARLARAHGGSLTVDDAEGGGAVFILDLPRDATAGPRDDQPHPH